jgi:hypothetical protein
MGQGGWPLGVRSVRATEAITTVRHRAAAFRRSGIRAQGRRCLVEAGGPLAAQGSLSWGGRPARR